MKALFVIDMQEEYVGHNNRYGYDSTNLINKVNERILKAQSDGEIIIYIKNKKTLKSGAYISDLAKNLQVLSAYIFCKEKSSLFSNHEIFKLMEDNNVTEIETIGVDGNCCVASSAMDAVKEGLTVVFPCTCVGVKNTDRFLKKKEQLKKAGVKIIE